MLMRKEPPMKKLFCALVLLACTVTGCYQKSVCRPGSPCNPNPNVAPAPQPKPSPCPCPRPCPQEESK